MFFELIFSWFNHLCSLFTGMQLQIGGHHWHIPSFITQDTNLHEHRGRELPKREVVQFETVTDARTKNTKCLLHK